MIEFLYPFALLLACVTGVIIAISVWWWYKDVWYGFLDWLDDYTTQLFYDFLDLILGKHEKY